MTFATLSRGISELFVLLSQRGPTNNVARMVLIAAVAIIVCGWALYFVHVTSVWKAYFDRARDAAIQRGLLLREHADQAFTTVDIALQSLDARPDLAGIQAPIDRRESHQVLKLLRDSSRYFIGIGLIARSGHVAASADADSPAPIDLSDREYFRAHQRGPDLGMLIGAPIPTRPGNVLAMPVSRRLDDSDGGFAGVVAARVDPRPFEELYRASGADAVWLIRSDGTPLISTEAELMDQVSNAVISPRKPDETVPPESAVSELSRADGTKWLISYSRSLKYPLTIVAGIDLERRLSVWRDERYLMTGVAVASTALVLAMTFQLLMRVLANAKLAAELESAREAAEKARIGAEAANKAKSEFLAHMSHELRTPLNAISGFSQIMSNEMFGPIGTPQYVEYARIVHTSTTYLLDIINNILDLAKVDAGKWEVEPQRVEIHAVAEDLRNLTAGRAQAHGIRFQIDVPLDLPVIITDRRMLLQILVNLTANAIKFTPDGGSVSLTARSASEGGVRIEISDTGCGMSEEDIQRVLEPFNRASSWLARERHDTGLGLPLSRRFVALLGGQFEIESKLNHGTRIVICLPRQVPAIAPTDGRSAVADHQLK